MPSIALDKANFLALVLETLLYGMFTILFGASIYIILNKEKRAHNFLLPTLSIMWLLATTHWIIDVIRGLDAFVELREGSALAYYLNLADPLQAAKTAIYVTLTMVGDGFVIYRCFIVWGQKYFIIVFPITLLLGTAVAGYGATYAFNHAAPGAQVFLPAIVPWITSFIALTFSTNVICTCLIAYRIMQIQRGVKGLASGRSGARSALITFAESAALYAASVLSLLITYLRDSNAQYMVLDLTAPLIGITFSIIILRVSMGVSAQQTASTRVGKLSGPSERYQLENMRPLAVNVSHLVEINEGYTGENAKSFHSEQSFGEGV